jgi:hypothetical protein
VTVNWSCTDGGSGEVSNTASQTVSSEGDNLSAIGTCTDNAGNTASDTQSGIKIDKTAPILSLSLNPNTISVGGIITVNATASDPLSGIATRSCQSPDTSTPGPKSLSCSATDQAGNISSQTANYTVNVPAPTFTFSGFFRPIDNLPSVNSVNAGSSVPIKFSLGGNRGLNILAAGSPASRQYNCNSGAPIGSSSPTQNPGGSGLSYDASSDTYTYVWKTERSWEGTCRQLSLTLSDGMTYRANFRFR